MWMGGVWLTIRSVLKKVETVNRLPVCRLTKNAILFNGFNGQRVNRLTYYLALIKWELTDDYR